MAHASAFSEICKVYTLLHYPKLKVLAHLANILTELMRPGDLGDERRGEVPRPAPHPPRVVPDPEDRAGARVDRRRCGSRPPNALYFLGTRLGRHASLKETIREYTLLYRYPLFCKWEVKKCGPTVAATVTAHHLDITIDDVVRPGWGLRRLVKLRSLLVGLTFKTYSIEIF